VEALIRWQHPENGLLAPATFLPAIENQPFAIELGEWVIHSALTQLAAWQAQGLSLAVSVNVGARQLHQPNFVLRLQEILAAHPEVEPTRLEIEIFEASALEDLVRMSQVIEDCHALGVTVALDDFGTGYSSLTYLRHLRVHLLKIDQSYVHGMLDDAEDLAVLRGVIGLANSFRRSVSAEGIETLAHGTLLLQLGCELGQGFFIARPMPAHELPAWMADWQPDPVWREQTAVAPEGIPLLYARIEHRTWVDAVSANLRGDSFVPPPRDQRQCKFWRWLDTEGSLHYGNMPNFESLKALHRQVHALGSELLVLQAVGRHAEAMAKLPELESLRDALLAELDRLEASSVS
jgi:EAL domain-containing protein (putative c-di-GMP-specific phosphodiesterase class I)